METKDISFFSLGLCLLLMVVPLGIFLVFGVKMVRGTLVSLARMLGQLALVGIFLEYLFDLNNGWINLAWVAAMIVFAAFSVIGSSKLSRRRFILPTLASFILSTLSVLLYFNAVVVRLDDVLDARYFITVAGMLLGNSLGGNIIGISQFYQNVRRDETATATAWPWGLPALRPWRPIFALLCQPPCALPWPTWPPSVWCSCRG